MSVPPRSLAPARRHPAPLDAHLHPRGLDVRDVRMEREPRDRVHEDGLAEGRAGPRAPLEVDRRLHVHERERHELGEAARRSLLLAEAEEVARPAARPLDRAEHDRRRRAQPHAVRRVVHLEPLLRRHLVRADDSADVVVEDLGRGAGKRGEPGLASGSREVVLESAARASPRPARPRARRTRGRAGRAARA